MSFDPPRSRSFHGDTRVLSQVREFVYASMDGSILPDRDRRMVVLAVDEAVANVIAHAYHPAHEGPVEVSVACGSAGVRVTVVDRGRAFDPEVVPDVDIVRHVEEGKTNGLGIFMMRKIMDEVDYLFEEGVRNVLSMTKYAPGTPGRGR